MKRRRSGKAAAQPPSSEVVDLAASDSDPDDPEFLLPSSPPAAPAPAASRLRRLMRGGGSTRPGAGDGGGNPAAEQQAQQAQQEQQAQQQGGEYEFVDSDPESADEELPKPKQRPTSTRLEAVVAGGRKRTLASATAAGGSPPGKGEGTSSHPAKRARAAAAAPGRKGGARGSKAAAAKAGSGKGGSGAGSKQTTLKGFGALFLSASQPPATQGTGSQGGSQPGSAAAAAAAEPPSAAAAAAAAAPAAAAAAAAAAAGSGEQWADKHAPRALSELVVHKKKVQEVQDWLNFYLEHRARHHTRALLVTGPPGCGKSITLRLVAASLGFEVVEWMPPVPTLWADYTYQAGAGVRYTSKLDEFDMFVTRCKFAALPLSSSSTPAGAGAATQPQPQQQQASLLSLPSQRPAAQQQPPLAAADRPASQPGGSHEQLPPQQPLSQRGAARLKLLLVDDLPHVADAERRARVAAALQDLATTARCPVVIVATSDEGGGGGGGSKGGGGGGSKGGGGGYSTYGAGGAGAGMTNRGLHKDFLAALDAAGAGCVAFNPITALNTQKALQAIADAEGLCLEPDTLAGIARGAGGDLRSAIQALQLLGQGPAARAAAAGGGRGGGKKGKAKAPRRPRKGTADDPEACAASEAAQARVASAVGRDARLSVYHAIGKLLHYKRIEPPDKAAAKKGSKATASQQEQPGAKAAAAVAAAAAGAHDGEQQPDGGGGGASQQLQAPDNLHAAHPLRLNPEQVVQGSGLEALQVTAFLGENYTHFLADDAMEQAALAASHISDAAFLACARSSAASATPAWDEADANGGSLAASAAACVAARGVLYANTRPAPSRWLPLKGPSCFLPDRAATSNLRRVGDALQALQDDAAAGPAGAAGAGPALALAGQLLHAGRQQRAAQVLPFMHALARHESRLWLHALLPRSWAYVWGGSLSERASPAMQGASGAAVRDALAAAADAVVQGAHGASQQPPGAAPAGQGEAAEGQEHAAALQQPPEEAASEAIEEIEDDDDWA